MTIDVEEEKAQQLSSSIFKRLHASHGEKLEAEI